MQRIDRNLRESGILPVILYDISDKLRQWIRSSEFIMNLPCISTKSEAKRSALTDRRFGTKARIWGFGIDPKDLEIRAEEDRSRMLKKQLKSGLQTPFALL
jgi:hypothetical protein